AEKLKQVICARCDACLIICAEKFESRFSSKLECEPTPECQRPHSIEFLALLCVKKLSVDNSNANGTWIRHSLRFGQHGERFVIFRCVKQRCHHVRFTTAEWSH